MSIHSMSIHSVSIQPTCAALSRCHAVTGRPMAARGKGISVSHPAAPRAVVLVCRAQFVAHTRQQLDHIVWHWGLADHLAAAHRVLEVQATGMQRLAPKP